MDWTALVQEPCDGPKMATTPSANWSQAITEESGHGVSEVLCALRVGSDFDIHINTWGKEPEEP